MLTTAQLITLACQDARKIGSNGTGFSPVAGQKLNLILNELAFLYDLPLNVFPTTVALTGIPAGPSGWHGVMPGIGPYALPSNYLRMEQDEVIYNYQGAPQKMVNVDLSDIDFLGLYTLTTNYPSIFATDINSTLQPLGFPALYVWPPPSGAITLDLRYYGLQPDIVTPETSAAMTPAFPFQNYLLARLTSELLKPDPRWKEFRADADMLLNAYLKNVDDSEGRAMVCKMDPRFFSPAGSYSRLPRTKLIDF